MACFIFFFFIFSYGVFIIEMLVYCVHRVGVSAYVRTLAAVTQMKIQTGPVPWRAPLGPFSPSTTFQR